MGDRYINGREEGRGRDLRPQFQQDRSERWDDSSRSWQSRNDRDSWSGDRSQEREEFRGDRSYQNAIDEERRRDTDGYRSDSRYRGDSGYRSNYSDSAYRGGSYGDDRSLGNADGYNRWDASYGYNPNRMNEGGYTGSQWQSGREWQSGRSQQDRGMHYGKGPKGYTRSDDRLKEDLSDRFMAHPDLDASDVEMDVNQGEVTLRGNVDSRQSKRLAEDICEDCHGVRHVNNQLRVNDRSRNTSGRFSDSSDARDDASMASGSANRKDKSH